MTIRDLFKNILNKSKFGKNDNVDFGNNKNNKSIQKNINSIFNNINLRLDSEYYKIIQKISEENIAYKQINKY